MAGSIPALPMSIEATDKLLSETVNELKMATHPSSRPTGFARGWFTNAVNKARRDVLAGRVDVLLEHRWRLMRRKARPEIEALEELWRASWPGTASQGGC